jgi:HTH-type transcriptional regulator / antitoxin HipB
MLCIPARESFLQHGHGHRIIFLYGNIWEYRPLKYTPAQLGELIRVTRKQLGVTQKDLAMTSGTGVRFLIDLEKGKTTCEIGKTLLILNTLGIRIALTPPASSDV